MILAVAALLFQVPAVGSVTAPQGGPDQPVVAVVARAPAEGAKVADAKGADAKTSDRSKSALPPVEPLTEPDGKPMSGVDRPPPPAFRPPDEAPVTHRKWWILLSATEHGSAGFDAWSTRYALSNGRVEADPIMRPFASSAAIYGAIQAIPIGLDYVAHRFQRSSGWTRHFWWAPQAVAAATFIGSGSYNVAHTN